MRVRLIILVLNLLIFSSSCLTDNKVKKNYDSSLKRDTITVWFYNDSFVFIDSVSDSNKQKTIIKFSTSNIVQIDTIQIIDSLAQEVHCTSKIKYTISEKNIQNIITKLEWVETIENYKRRLLIPIFRDVVRNRALLSSKQNLLNCNESCRGAFESDAKDSLSEFISIRNIEIEFRK